MNSNRGERGRQARITNFLRDRVTDGNLAYHRLTKVFFWTPGAGLTQGILHGARRPSHMILPIVSR